MKKNILLLLFLFNISSDAQTIGEYSRNWVSFTQVVGIQSKKNKKFKLEAFVKVDTEDQMAWAGIWARVDTKNGEDGFFDNMGDRPISTNIWQKCIIEGHIDENSKSLNFGGLCLNNGKFYFDNFKLFIENDKGILEPVKISNGDFEEKLINGDIPFWKPDKIDENYVRIIEFKNFTTDDKVEGKKALLIEGKGIKNNETRKIMPVKGFSPHIGTLIAMLENLKERVESQVKNMTQYELDYLYDANVGSIGALIMHLAAAEKYYQVYTFENREFNEEEKKIWETALDMYKGGPDELKGHNAQYYLDIFNEVRSITIDELKKRDDAWLELVHKEKSMNNFYAWFHVMEHQSSHLGQILFLKKKIPPEPEVNLEQPIKN